MIAPDIITVDLSPWPNTKAISDAHAVGFRSDSFDGVFCTGLLEHIPDPSAVLREIWRILKSGGVAHLEVPFFQGYHPDPQDYWRWTLDGFRLFCTRHGFDELDAGIHIGPATALTWTLQNFFGCLIGSWRGSGKARALFNILISPLQLLDLVLIHRPEAHRIACAVYFVGRKPTHSQPLSHNSASNAER